MDGAPAQVGSSRLCPVGRFAAGGCASRCAPLRQSDLRHRAPDHPAGARRRRSAGLASGSSSSAGASVAERPTPWSPQAAVPEGERALVIVPTYNERDNIPRIVPAHPRPGPSARGARGGRQLARTAPASSSDEMARDGPAGARAAPRREAGARTRLPRRLRLGAQVADRSSQYIFEMDADFSHDPAHLTEFLHAVQDADLVLGSRYREGQGDRRELADDPAAAVATAPTSTPAS